ncbi:MAG: hypothetical protein NTZ50_01280 [Chloroflexi bacterium]|nr:hypothetical protein [Chloroflexota bacterium]
MPSALLYFLLAFGAVWLLERQAHRRLQQVFLLLTGHIDAATLLYSFVLLPGVPRRHNPARICRNSAHRYTAHKPDRRSTFVGRHRRAADRRRPSV